MSFLYLLDLFHFIPKEPTLKTFTTTSFAAFLLSIILYNFLEGTRDAISYLHNSVNN